MTRYTSPSSLLLCMAIWSLVNISFTMGYNWNCDLYCYNGGECKHGKGKFGNFAGLSEEEGDALPFAEQKHANGMYCSCPVGYTGLQCEIKFVVCGENGEDQHTCFNGSECKREKTDKGTIFYRCECDANQSILSASYAGKFCEHISTIFCSKHSNSGSSTGGSNSFCVNGGKCLNKDDPDNTEHAGCECPDGWTGSHCELQDYDYFDIELNKNHHLGIGAILVIILLSCMVCAGFCMWYQAKMDEKRRNQRYSTRPIGKQKNRVPTRPNQAGMMA